jgi:hypothetical protein
VGRFVRHDFTNVPLVEGERVVELSPADVDKLLAETHRWESAQETIDSNRAWRDSPRAQTVLDLPNDSSGNAALDGTNLLRNIVQDLIRVTQRQARQLNTFWRLNTHPQLVPVDDDDAGPGD